MQAAVGEPCACRDVLCVAELRGRQSFSTKIRRNTQRAVRLHDERGTSLRRTGNDTDFLSTALGIGVYCRTRTDVGEINRIGEDCLHRARTGVIYIPIQAYVRTEPLLIPTIALTRHRMRHQRLDV